MNVQYEYEYILGFDIMLTAISWVNLSSLSASFTFIFHVFPTSASYSGTDQHFVYKSSAVAEMGNRGHNRHGPK